jgi:hypothetical protein
MLRLSDHNTRHVHPKLVYQVLQKKEDLQAYLNDKPSDNAPVIPQPISYYEYLLKCLVITCNYWLHLCTVTYIQYINILDKSFTVKNVFLNEQVG